MKFFTDFFRIVFEWEHHSRSRYSRDSKPSSMLAMRVFSGLSLRFSSFSRVRAD
uniref:Uncharacterized protein n=1 Tax=Candidatus Kentrum sp. UNK TaxID=2126344 RepID=A0A451B5T2_9GAMM|nr:MAG: hypothetical protein BECKUNK1418G_GA0071005_12472 [Candidatus Kentron sp. UNK]VFK73654.1 MAG: hypothetical protein BECKUNK1418H_GA0071006_12422 [Candidatus Kentron sp. UNK]